MRQAQLLSNYVLDFLEKNDKLNYVLTASSESNKVGKEIDNGGRIISSRCYTILDVQRVVGNDGKPDRIIKMRNPWGRNEWTKDWNDNSNKWTSELKKNNLMFKKKLWCIWISIKSFITEFQCVYDCKFNPTYLYTAMKLNIDINKGQLQQKIALMKVYEKTHSFISVVQSHKSLFRQKDGHEYSLARLIIGQLDTQTNEVLHYSCAAFGCQRNIVAEKSFYLAIMLYMLKLAFSNIFIWLKIGQFSELSFPKNEEKKCIAKIYEENVYSIEQGIKRISGTSAGYKYFWLTGVKHIGVCPPFQNKSTVKIIWKPMETVMLKSKQSQTVI